MSTKFFDTLLKLVKEEKAAMIKTSLGYTCGVFEGNYWGWWSLGRSRTIWNPMKAYPADTSVSNNYLKAIAARLGYSGWGQLMVHTAKSPDIKTMTNLYRRYCEKYDGFDETECMVAAYGGDEWLDLYWSKNQYEQQDLSKFFRSSMFEKMGCHRRPTVMYRFLTTKKKKAYRATFRSMDNRVLNWVRSQHERDYTYLITQQSVREAFAGVTSQHANLDTIWKMSRMIRRGSSMEDFDRSIFQAMKNNPGNEFAFMVLREEVPGYLFSVQDSPEATILEAQRQRIIGLDYPNMPIAQVRVIHDEVVEMVRRRHELYVEQHRIQNQQRAKTLEKYQVVIDYLEEKQNQAVEAWTRYLDDLDPQMRGVALLRTPEDYLQEGERMHHCVNGYYKISDAYYKTPRGRSRAASIHYACTDELEALRNCMLESDKEARLEVRHLYCWHVEVGKEMATFCFERHERAGTVTYKHNQLRGIQNRPISKQMVAFVQSLCDKMELGIHIING